MAKINKPQMQKIDKDAKYLLKDIVRLGLIPDLTSYHQIYHLATLPNEKEGSGRLLCKETTVYSIKSEHKGKPWQSHMGQIYVKGSELLKFLELINAKENK